MAEIQLMILIYTCVAIVASWQTADNHKPANIHDLCTIS